MKKMDINEFDYNLPENLIAQTPIENRSESKLLRILLLIFIKEMF